MFSDLIWAKLNDEVGHCGATLGIILPSLIQKDRHSAKLISCVRYRQSNILSLADSLFVQTSRRW